MPIMSYLAYPVEGRKQELIERLRTLGGCSVQPSTNYDLLVVVTDTEGREEEEALQIRLKQIDSLNFLALVSGYSDPEHKPEESAK